MISVSFFCDEQKRIVSFEMSGHAGSGPYGYDIVCAACSALSINSVNSISRLAGYDLIVELDEGYLFAALPEDLTDRQNDITQILLSSLFIGLSEIEKEYPKFIQLTKK
ncbi:ribosomal-processing cysteine protease Prp [Vagococcus vulneris]|uniref:Ribosomal processing cysteine protease Prp n=1 Tax=Vagococcus vulneris TaxID=1977869 RepID=A0A429ZWR9_9ENTE|nr:ribosomal-processing cysteine protease Prp [Vagococcus vulneris]RST98056.1 hypothetical protein CBF37_09135 [Vagococcus vulneris]